MRPTRGTPAGLLDLYSQSASFRETRALYGVYVDLVTAQAIALSHLRKLGYAPAIVSLTEHLAAVEDFAVSHLKREIEIEERHGGLEDEPA